MPIVISYQDVEALGTLAFKGAEMEARAEGEQFNRGLAADISQGRDATAASLQAISSRERIADQQIAFNVQQAGANQQFRYDQLNQADDLARANMESDLRQDQIRYQYGLQQELMGNISQEQRDEQLHQNRMTEIGHRASFKSDGGGVMGASGVPDKKFAQQEAQRHGNLIPYNPEGSFDVAQAQKAALATAQSLSALPTDQLENYQQSGKVQEKWRPYVDAILQSRRQVGGGQPSGANPGGHRMPQSRGGGPGLGGGTGLAGDPSGLSDAQLNQLATDPVAAMRFFGAPP